tara:strand:+ start:10651 stop:10902 length:252 start_codon:yes stop_codon:yes gene_type:complete
MQSNKAVYFDEETQKVRWTTSCTSSFKFNYKYVGQASENEFNILIDLLWHLYEEKKITYDEFHRIYAKLRMFCDEVMGLVDEV